MSFSMISEVVLKTQKHISSFLTLLKFLLLATDFQFLSVNHSLPAKRLPLAFVIFPVFTKLLSEGQFWSSEAVVKVSVWGGMGRAVGI